MKPVSHLQQTIWKSLIILLGNALYSLTVVLFLVPSGLITGGATGIALAVNRVSGLPVSGVLFVINMTMLALGWAVLGRAFALNTLASSLLSPAFIGLWEYLLAGRILTDDILLCTIFAGLGIGSSLGMVIRALVLQKWFRLPVSATMMLMDLVILMSQAMSSPMEKILYGVVMVIVYTIVLDKVLMLGESRTEVKIISPKADEIRTVILEQLDRGVTELHGAGGYTHEPSTVLLSIVSNRELPRLEKLVHSIDPACFLIISHVTEVRGRGFSISKDYQ